MVGTQNFLGPICFPEDINFLPKYFLRGVSKSGPKVLLLTVRGPNRKHVVHEDTLVMTFALAPFQVDYPKSLKQSYRCGHGKILTQRTSSYNGSICQMQLCCLGIL